MRDVATLVWVFLLVIGVISSMVASVRRQMNAQRMSPRGPAPSPAQQYQQYQQQQPQPQRPQPQLPQQLEQQLLRQQLVQQVKQVPPRPAAPAGPAAPTPSVPARRAVRRKLFPGGQALVSAVIAAEVLGKPRALNDEYFRS